MTRSLVVLDRLPYPPMGGQQLRYRQAIEALLGLGPVTLLLLGRPGGAAPPGIELVTADPEPDRSLAHRWASVLGRRGKKALRAKLQARHQAGLRNRLAELVDRVAPDLLVVESAELAGYLPPLTAPGRSVIYDAHNVERLLWGELVPLRVQLGDPPGSPRFRERIIAGEAALAAAADEVWVCSAADRQLFARTYPSSPARVRVVPNAVDTFGLAHLARAREAPRPADRPPTVLFTANFGYAPNLDAARILVDEIRPRLRAASPALRVVLCGQQPPAELQAAAARDPGVVVTGAVADVGPWLAACDAVAVPLRHGGGTRIKILEALAAGCPVVSTRKGAEGLELEDHRHLRLADTPDGMAAALLWCLAEPAAASAMARRGGRQVEARYSWSANAALVRAAVSALARKADPGRLAAG